MARLQPFLSTDVPPASTELMPALLICVLCSVLLLTTLAVLTILRWRRLRAEAFDAEDTEAFKFRSFVETPNFSHLNNRRPQTWLAIRSHNLDAVQKALSLQHAKPCLWTDGLAGEKRLFVAPPVSGWILVFGPSLPEPDEDVDSCFRFLLGLSQKLGHVQYFSVNSALNYHAWARIESGHVIRGYAWAGRTLWNQGTTTPQELMLRMRCLDYTATAELSSFGGGDFGNAEKVHLLAAQWSIDPDAIDEGLMEHEWGIAGEPSRLF